MGFFDGLLGAVGGALTGGGSTLLSAGLGLAGNLIGGAQAQEGYDNAAAIGAATSQAQLDELKRAKAAGLGYIDEGAAKYANTLAPLLTERPILMPAYRGLTTQQQIGRDDLIRTGQASLASSGLRGAGRAGIGTVLDSVARYDAGARGANDAATLAAKATARAGADAARTGLAGVQANTGTIKANTELGTGSQISGAIGNQGEAASRLASQAGNTAGQMWASSGQLLGNTAQSWAGQQAGNSPNAPPLTPQYGQPSERAFDNQPKV